MIMCFPRYRVSQNTGNNRNDIISANFNEFVLIAKLSLNFNPNFNFGWG